jgi:hypothetical protein
MTSTTPAPAPAITDGPAGTDLARTRRTDPPAVSIPLPGLGTVELSRPELVYVGGIAALTVFGLLEWPVALVIGAGHVLAADRGSHAAAAAA